MISYIRGDVLFRNESSVVVDVGGIGYEVFVPYGVLCDIERRVGQIELYTYMQVREDAICLYGFATREDLRTFKLLISVNGVGPKVALGVMSYMTTQDLMLAVLADDAKAIAKAPGIAAKTAGKVILELKDKFKLTDALEGTDGFVGGAGLQASDSKTGKADSNSKQETASFAAAKNEAVQALVALGYSSSEALKAVRSIPADDSLKADDILRLSLKNL